MYLKLSKSIGNPKNILFLKISLLLHISRLIKQEYFFGAPGIKTYFSITDRIFKTSLFETVGSKILQQSQKYDSTYTVFIKLPFRVISSINQFEYY